MTLWLRCLTALRRSWLSISTMKSSGRFQSCACWQIPTFSVEIVELREATEEEIDHGHAHGPGGVEH